LEQRQLLAGDVAVSVVDGQLMVQGDDLDNKIMITAGAEAGSLVITGLDGTNLIQNGDPPAAEVTVTGVHSAHVELGEGNDLVAVVGANLRGQVAINTGGGDDRVLVGTGGDAAELVGQLPDDVSVSLRGALRINTDSGNDQIAIDDATVRGHIGLNAGEGDDLVSLGSTAAVDESGARLGLRGSVHINLGDGNDELNIDQLRVRGGIVARGGDGDDTVNVSQTKSNSLVVLGAGGVDTVTLADLDVHHLGVRTGEGNDSVDIRDSVFSHMGVSLGDGDDTLTTAALEGRLGLMLGGLGEDTLNVLSESTFGREVIRGFEIPPDVNVNGLPFARRPLAQLLHRLL
jgi:hypothetical protein